MENINNNIQTINILGTKLDVVISNGELSDFEKITKYLKKTCETLQKQYPSKTSMEISILASLQITDQLYRVVKSNKMEKSFKDNTQNNEIEYNEKNNAKNNNFPDIQKQNEINEKQTEIDKNQIEKYDQIEIDKQIELEENQIEKQKRIEIEKQKEIEIERQKQIENDLLDKAIKNLELIIKV